MAKNFKIEQVDQNRFIKTNDLKEITNPSMFSATGGPSPDGLLSNNIFGITKDERSGIYAYISLGEDFIEPYFYNIWLKIDRNLKSIVYETKYFKIDSNGYLVEDENGETGIKFLKKNIKKINFKNTKKSSLLKVLMQNKDKMFTDKFIIIPPFYRDVNTTSGRIGVGEINKLYINLMNNTRALNESNDYGLDLAGGIRGRTQDLMLEIYNWFCVGESIVGGEHTGAGIFKKFGIMKRATMSKTTDYGSRLVLSSQKINVESKKDLMVDMDYSAIPLSATCAVAYQYMIYYLRQYFNNEFGGKIKYPYVDSNGNIDYVTLKNPEIEFSDSRFDKEINELIHGYSNRFKRIMVPNEEGKEIYLKFKGYSITEDEYKSGVRETGSIIDRHLTWVDVLYQAAVEATEDKNIMITRYPVSRITGV